MVHLFFKKKPQCWFLVEKFCYI